MNAGAPRLRHHVVAPGEFPGTREPLRDDEVSVWLAEPAAGRAPAERQRLRALLSDDERERLERFRFDEDRLAFLTAHALLRMALSRHAAVSPEAWTFQAGPYGQPSIAAPRCGLCFSLSHTRGLVACAVAADRPLGIDVEDASRRAPLEVAERYFAPGERRDIGAAPPHEQARRFFEYWTLKEAYAKALGLGLQLPFDRFELRREGTGWRVTALDPAPGDAGAGFWLHAWSTPTHQAALAVGART